jgi:hypothetical protein
VLQEGSDPPKDTTRHLIPDQVTRAKQRIEHEPEVTGPVGEDLGLQSRWAPLKTPFAVGVTPEALEGLEQMQARIRLTERPEFLIEEHVGL